MVDSQSFQTEHVQGAFDDFRQIAQNLVGLDAEGQVPFLKYELLQALERAAEFQDRNRDLERQLEELQNRIEANAAAAEEARATPELEDVKARAKNDCRPSRAPTRP